MFDEKDWAIMLLWDEMPRGIPGLAHWRDEAALGCVKLICRDHVFSMDAYRDRLRKLGLSPERPKLVKGSLKGRTLAIEWASRCGIWSNLVRAKTSFLSGRNFPITIGQIGLSSGAVRKRSQSVTLTPIN